jgi:acyl carrier protein
MAKNIDRLSLIIQRELALDPRELSPDTRLTDVADSLDWVNLLAAMEETFGLQISIEQGLRLQTLQDLMLLVSQAEEPRLVAA